MNHHALRAPFAHGSAALHRSGFAGVLLLSLAALGCAHGDSVKSRPQAGPDLGGIVRIGTKRGWAHACPITSTHALISAHVVDPMPMDPNAPLFAGRWSDSFGNKGSFRPIPSMISNVRDLALIESVSGPFAKWFAIAGKPPFEGQPLYAVGYDWRKRDDAFGLQRYVAKFLREEAGRLVLSVNPKPGASGGCVLNANGEVVGIVESMWPTEDGEWVGAAVAIWGEAFEIPVAQP